MKGQILLPILVFSLVFAMGTSSPQPSSCPVTYCVSLISFVSAGASGPAFQPALSVISIAQMLAIAFALSPSVVAFGRIHRVVPSSALKAIDHLRRLGSASRRTDSPAATTYWLPIESVSAGRITSKMLRGVAFFGPGRR
jgi:hypothetical protein